MARVRTKKKDDVLNLDEFINFDSLDKKKFDDLPDYDVIRGIKSPYDDYNPIDPVSVDEIEAWMKKNNLQSKQQQQKRIQKGIANIWNNNCQPHKPNERGQAGEVGHSLDARLIS